MKQISFLFGILAAITPLLAQTVDKSGFEATSDSFDYAEIRNDPFFQFIQAIRLFEVGARELEKMPDHSSSQSELSRAIKGLDVAQQRFLEFYAKRNVASDDSNSPIVRVAESLQRADLARALSKASIKPTAKDVIELSKLYSTLTPSPEEMINYYKSVNAKATPEK